MRNKRRDGKRVIWPDGYHNILPYIMPKRTEAEVSMTEQFDVTDLVKYMAERNEKERHESQDLPRYMHGGRQDYLPQA